MTSRIRRWCGRLGGAAARGTAAAALLLLPAPEARAGFDPVALAPHQGRAVTAIALAGHKVTREYVITREIHTRVGEPLDLARLAGDVQRLENLAIFAAVRVSAADDGAGVRLTFELREMPPWVPFVAFAYTEENGFSVGPGLSSLNLTGRQIGLSATAYFGGTTQYRAKLSWPWIARDHVSLDFYAAHLDRDDQLNEFRETSDEVTPTVGTYLGRHGRLAGTFAFLRLRSDVDGKTLSPDNVDQLVRLGLSLGWDTRDSWPDPHSGWQNELALLRTGGPLGGDGDFWTLDLDVRRWVPTAPRQKLLLSGLLSLQSGTLEQDLPVYLSYHLGGANSIRGYRLEELGRTLFGKNQLLGTLEYSFTLLPLRAWDVWKWSLRLGLDLALFADAGIAWSEPEQLALKRARGGLGAGLRLLVPGSEMVRFDVGWSPAGGFQLHLGGLSKPSAQRARLR